MSKWEGKHRENEAEKNNWRNNGWKFPKFIDSRSSANPKQDKYKENHMCDILSKCSENQRWREKNLKSNFKNIYYKQKNTNVYWLPITSICYLAFQNLYFSLIQF